MSHQESPDAPEQSGVARPGLRESFAIIEARAREVLRARGFSEDQIDAQLSKARREEDGVPDPASPADDDSKAGGSDRRGQ